MGTAREADAVAKLEPVASGSNLPRVRARNLTVTLDALRKLQPISRSGLAAATRLTAATMSNLVADLASLGFIREERSPERRIGRRPVLLSLDPDGPQLLGIEISRSRVLGVVTDLAGGIRASARRPAPAQRGSEATLAIVQGVIEELWDEGAPPAGIGVGIPGPVDSGRGRIMEPPNFPGWSGLPLGDILHDRWGVPVLVDDDAKTAALGEHWFGAGRTVDTMLYVSIGEGIGAGLVVHNELYRGTHELAGEIGHMTLDLDGPACECGNRGCLETFVSLGAIRERAAALGLEHEGGPELELARADAIEAVERLAGHGHAGATALKDRVYRYLAAGIVNAVNCYDPDAIIVGGPLVERWNDLCPQLRMRVRGRSFGVATQAVDLRSAALGGYASVVGAAVLVIQHLFRHPGLLRPEGDRKESSTERLGAARAAR